MENYDKAIDILKEYKQEHIINLIEKSSLENKNKIIDQVLNIDFEELKELYDKIFEDKYIDLEELQPISGINPDKLSQKALKEYENLGTDIIKANKFAVATMAGGQGTRLRTSKS